MATNGTGSICLASPSMMRVLRTARWPLTMTRIPPLTSTNSDESGRHPTFPYMYGLPLHLKMVQVRRTLNIMGSSMPPFQLLHTIGMTWRPNCITKFRIASRLRFVPAVLRHDPVCNRPIPWVLVEIQGNTAALRDSDLCAPELGPLRPGAAAPSWIAVFE
jgi:hypothetical protein